MGITKRLKDNLVIKSSTKEQQNKNFRLSRISCVKCIISFNR